MFQLYAAHIRRISWRLSCSRRSNNDNEVEGDIAIVLVLATMSQKCYAPDCCTRVGRGDIRE